MADPQSVDIALTHPERQLAIAHAPRLSRESLATLLALDERFAQIVARAKEPAIGLMRLTWWRDALAALDKAPPPGEPLLHAAAALRPDRVSGADIAAMTEGWEALLDDPDLSGETLHIHARARGARLFRLGARVLGDEQDRFAAAGEGWALADLARWRPEQADLLHEAAAPLLAKAFGGGRWPGAVRPLGMLVVLAREDVRRGAEQLRPPASRGRLMRMLLHRWTGR
jgi:15-cis-phytoene synthase